MARIRSIHPDACDSRKLGSVSSDAERLYWRLQTHCDDHGRCEDDARLIWMRCAPMVKDWTDDIVGMLLDELAAAGLLSRYETDGRRAIQISAWANYQHPRKPGGSRFAPPNSTSAEPVRDQCVTLASRVPVGEEWSGTGTGGESEGNSTAADLTEAAVDKSVGDASQEPTNHRNGIAAVRDQLKGTG